MRSILLPGALCLLALSACRQQAPTVPAASEAPGPATEAASPVQPASTPVAGQDAPPPAAQAPQAPAAAGEDRSQVNARIDTVLGDHARYENVIDALQKAIADHDAPAVAALVGYPFVATIDGKTVKIADARAFVADYDKIVTPQIAGAVVAQKYPDLFVNDKGIMFGDGEVWINGICRDDACRRFDARVVTIQSTR